MGYSISTPPRAGSRREKLWDFVKRCHNGFAWHEAKDTYDEGYPSDWNQPFGNPRRHSSLEVGRLLKEWAVRTSRGWYRMKPELIEKFVYGFEVNPSENVPASSDGPHNDVGTPEIRDMAWSSKADSIVLSNYADAIAEAINMIDEIGSASVWSLEERMMGLRAHLVGLEDIIRNP